MKNEKCITKNEKCITKYARTRLVAKLKDYDSDFYDYKMLTDNFGIALYESPSPYVIEFFIVKVDGKRSVVIDKILGR